MVSSTGPTAQEPGSRLSPAASRLLALAALAAGLGRWLTRTSVVYNWDSVHYLLAQDRYDILEHQPHPPGSYYYILLARAARLLTSDPHNALLLLGALFGAALVPILFLLGQELGGKRAGWLAAAIGASAPLFWFYGSVGLNYGPAGTLAALLALGCVRLCRGSSLRSAAVLAGAAFGALGGFRPFDAAFLAPAFLWALATAFRRDRAAATCGLAVAGAVSLGWLIPNVLNTGGLGAYLASLRAQDQLFQRSSVFIAGWPAWNDAVFTHRRCLESALGAGWLPLIAAGALALWRRGGRSDARRSTPGALTILGLLIVLPAFTFYLLGHFNSPGYALTYSGFLVAVAAATMSQALPAARPRGADTALAALVGVLVAANAALFLAGWPGAGKAGQRSLSAAEISDHSRYYDELRSFLARRHPPGRVRLLCSWNSTDGLRVVQTLLPEYADDTAQAVGYHPPLPPQLAALRFLRLMTPAEIAAEGREVFAVVRTDEDPGYHLALFGDRFERVVIGAGHSVWRLR